jgi:hypothetical protein
MSMNRRGPGCLTSAHNLGVQQRKAEISKTSSPIAMDEYIRLELIFEYS